MLRKLLAAGAATGAVVLLIGPRVAVSEDKIETWRDLEAPKLLMDGDKPIDVAMGNAAPAVFDVDGDGKKDLVVGQFEGSLVRVYKNKGTNKEPKFDGWEYLKAGGKNATVPGG